MSDRLERWGAPLVFALAGVLLAADALPGLHWHDTAEFAGVARVLGVSHSPGHPLTILWLHATELLLPVGDAAFRANLGSGLALALALAAFYRLLRQSAATLPALVSMLVALVPLAAPPVWLQGVRAEVYAPQAVLTVLILWLALRLIPAKQPPDFKSKAPTDTRNLVGLGLCFGLAGANHSLLALWLMPVALLAMFWARVGPRAWLAGALAGLLGLVAYALPALRALAGDIVGWGRPDSPTGLFDLVLAREWHWFLDPEARLGALDYTAAAVVYGIEALGPAVALGAGLALGLGVLPAWRRHRGALALGLLWPVVTFMTQHPFRFDPGNPDVGGYFVGAALAFVFLGHLGLSALLGELPAVARPFARPAFALLPAAALVFGLADRDPGHRRGARSAEAYGRTAVNGVPPEGALVTSDYTSHFVALGLRALEGLRPDVAPIFRGQMHTTWFHDRLALRHPRWAERLADLPADPIWTSHQVRYEPGVNLDRLGPLSARFAPDGLLFRVGTGDDPNLAAVDATLAAFAAVPTTDLDARRALAFHHLHHALIWRARGTPNAARLAQAHLAFAAQLVGEAAVSEGLAAAAAGGQATGSGQPLPAEATPAITPPGAVGDGAPRPPPDPGDAAPPAASGSEASVE